MKLRLNNILSFLLLCLCGTLYAQNELPLEIGNRWEFRNFYQDSGGHYQEKEPSKVIVKMDSIMPNGKSYFLLEGSGAYISGWVRTDSSWFFYYDKSDSTEYPYINFNMQRGDTLRNEKIIGFITLDKKDTIDLFDQRMIRLTFQQQLSYDNIMAVSFSNKYGLLGESSYYFGERDYSQLSGCIIGDSTYGTILSVDQSVPKSVKGYALYQNYPNPFNPVTSINYTIPNSDFVSIEVYDVLGNKIETLVNEYKTAGNYQAEFNGSNISSGVYFCRMQDGDFVKTRKMILLR